MAMSKEDHALVGQDEDVVDDDSYVRPYAAQDTSLTGDSSHAYMKVKTSHLWKGAMIATGVVFMMGVAVGVWAGSSSNFAAPTKSKSLETTGLDSAPKPSTWVSTAPTGPMHPDASPRSLSAAEFFQTPKFSEKVADKITMLHNDFTGQGGMYSDPEEKLQAHHATAHAVSSFIGNLSMSHPQVAMLLHDMQVDDSQQGVSYNILDHFTDKNTMKVGAEVMDASVNGLLEGRSGIKRRLQEKLGARLEPLRRIKAEIFPKNFNVEQKEGMGLRGSGNDMDGDEAHMQMLKQSTGGEDLRSITSLKKHLANNENLVATVGQAAGRRLMGGWAIWNLIGSIIGSIINTILGNVIPGKTAGYLTMGIGDALTVMTCAQWSLAPLNWIGCVINLINSVLVTVFTFV